MFRYLLLIPCLLLGALAFQAHDEAEQVTVDTVHPDYDPRFSSIAGMDTFEMLAIDSNLASAYNKAWLAYSNDESYARLEKSGLIDQRDEYLAFIVVVLAIFALTFLPWGRWTQSLFQGVSRTAVKGGSAVGSVVSKISGEDRTIIKREGLDRYSVSAELKNWKDLLDQGVVTEDEFEKAKAKLLGRE
jgi:hypothetical protein